MTYNIRVLLSRAGPIRNEQLGWPEKKGNCFGTKEFYALLMQAYAAVTFKPFPN